MLIFLNLEKRPRTADSERTVVLIAASIAAFITPFMSASVNVALPSIGREMGASTALLSWVATSFLLSAAVLLVPLGKLADIRGRRKLFAAGMAVFSAASVACALAPSVPILIALRAVQGIGGAMIYGTATALLTSVFPPGERGRALGINVGTTYVGLSIGPFLGGILTQHLGWRSLFLAAAVLGAAGLGVILAGTRSEWAEAKGERFDLRGSLVYTVGLLALMGGLAMLPAFRGVVLLIAGAACLSGFTLVERRAAHPVLSVALFRGNPVFTFSNLAALISYSATFAVSYLMSLYLQEVRGMSPQSAGLLLVCQPILQAVFSPVSGRLSDTIQPRTLASIGMALSAGGLALLAFLDATMGLGLAVAGLAVIGIGFALFSSPNTNAVMGAVERRSLGVASAVLATMRLLGQTLSMALAMVAFALSMRGAPIAPSSFPGFIRAMRAVLLIGAALLAAGIFASLARGRMGPVADPAERDERRFPR